MSKQWSPDGTFHMGINMAGAVSAGAYTAGVLDFLFEALEEWYAAKGRPGAAVPRHNVSIDVFSGASAGGMCAAIAAVMVQGGFQHIPDPSDFTVKDTTNKFYESWVNKIDIEPLLAKRDLEGRKNVISLLDSTIIDEIADYAIAPVAPQARPYIADALTLFLTLTNVRGVPYLMSGDAEGSAEEDIAYYADKLQFETVHGRNLPLAAGAQPLPLGSSGGAWTLLKEAAKATGAFPLFLAPRRLSRNAVDYTRSPWLPVSDASPQMVQPDWPLTGADAVTTLNVDGGMTDNDPFQLAHDYLAVRNPQAERNAGNGNLENPRGQDAANCAVLTVAPFPAQARYDAQYDFDKNSSIFGMLPNLLNVLISQSRFQGESLSSVMSGKSFSRFVLAPSDAEHPGQVALQCARLGAFGGFFERGFRAHDYQLGRRNCQRFLVEYFRLTITNPIIEAGLAGLDAAGRAAVVAACDPQGRGTLPIIPLCGSAKPEVGAPALATIPADHLDEILNWIVNRLHAVTKPLVESAIGSGFGDLSLRLLVDTLISTYGKAKLSDYLRAEFKDVTTN